MDEKVQPIPEQPITDPAEQDLDSENRDGESGRPLQLDSDCEEEQEARE